MTTANNSSRIYGSALLLLAMLALFAPAETRAQDDKPGGTNLFITYRCPTANRVEFLRGLQTEGLAQFEKWKRAGVIADYLLLHNQYVDAVTWDAMVILTFDRYAQTEKWVAVEKEFPGGLTPSLLKLAAPHTSYLADLTFGNGKRGDRSKSIFVVIPYEFQSKPEYTEYIKGYGVPQFDGWIEKGAISSYGIYMNQHATGQPWGALLLFEYNGIEGLGRREIVKQEVRRELVNNPEWKKLSDNKATVRVEQEVVMSRPVMPR